MNPQLLLFIIKLVLGGIAAFLAIFVMSKTRDASWMFLVAYILAPILTATNQFTTPTAKIFLLCHAAFLDFTQ